MGVQRNQVSPCFKQMLAIMSAQSLLWCSPPKRLVVWWSEAGVWELVYRVEAWSKPFCKCTAHGLQFEREPWPSSRLSCLWL